MGRPIKTTHSSTVDTGYASGIGGTIGQPYSSTGVYTIDFQYADANGTTYSHGYAYKQIGKNRFKVGDSSNIGSGLATITLVNSTDGNIANLAANTGIVSCYGNATYQFYAKSITSKTVKDWNDGKFVYDIQRAADATYGNVATY